MQQQTAVEWLRSKLLIKDRELEELFEQAKKIEKEQIINAIMYALDEDGHTGDWKIKFANDYYNKLNKGYDFSNKTRERFFGDKTV